MRLRTRNIPLIHAFKAMSRPCLHSVHQLPLGTFLSVLDGEARQTLRERDRIDVHGAAEAPRQFCNSAGASAACRISDGILWDSSARGYRPAGHLAPGFKFASERDGGFELPWLPLRHRQG